MDQSPPLRTPEEQAELLARHRKSAYGPPPVVVPREASPKTLTLDMQQRLADDDLAFQKLKSRIESLNLYEEFTDVVPYKNAKPRTVPVSRPEWNDHPLVKQILEWAQEYRQQKEYSREWRKVAVDPETALDAKMEALRMAMKADGQAAEYRKGIDNLFGDVFDVLAGLHKKRLDATLTVAQMELKHEHHKDILRAKGFGDPNSASDAELLRISGGTP